jgi:mono/diheme cytochrome c family protein
MPLFVNLGKANPTVRLPASPPPLHSKPTTMKTIASLVSNAAVVGLSVVALAAFGETSSSPAPSAQLNSSSLIERGRYLVNGVGLCSDCHSPRDAAGHFIEGKHLTGAPVGVTPLAPMPWSTVAPRLAGLPDGFSGAELVHFLMTGEQPHGRPAPRPPMPPYRLDRVDAEAVVAYLASLTSPETRSDSANAR